MCGLYGTTIGYHKKEIEAKLERINFRGPDFMGIASYKNGDSNITFGHNRLAILDLDQRSNQPFTYEQFIHVVFNGEIYNYIEIKLLLSKKGYNFKTTSDTEVICAAYLEYGEDCVDHFNGMFAFVIYDSKNQILFGARDRLGQKPFYYYQKGKVFEFASQISSIKLFNKNLSISDNSISKYMAWGYIPDPNSIFNEIKKLPAGHSFIFKIDSGIYQEKKYWDIDSKGENQYQGSYDDAKKDLESLLTDAVEKRMLSDVPLGVFLSGGIDSSLISSLANGTLDSKIKTFSVKFNNAGFDESQYALKVADHLGTDHHTIECNYKEGMDLIATFGDYYDEPFSDSSAIPSMLLAKYTKKHVTVALTGDGGDESFLGYHRYNWAKYVEYYYKLPRNLRPILPSLLKKIPYYKSKVIADVLSNPSLNHAYLNMVCGYNNDWFENSNSEFEVDYREYLFHENKNILERISDFDLKTYLNGDINTKVDRATMAFSLEARSPFLDYRIVEFARSLPTHYKFEGNNQKRILKDILYEYVPKQYFDRPKAGFEIPFKDWFRDELKDYVLDELNESALKEIPGLNFIVVKKMINQHMDGSWNRYALIWKLLVLKQWLNKNK